jgi:hypothetical protein
VRLRLRAHGHAGYLTTYANGTLTQSAVTVIGTGNSPLAQVAALEPRDYFYDAPLDQLTNTTLFPAWNLTIAPVASADWGACRPPPRPAHR